MGRQDAVQFTLEWAAEARRLGATVTFQTGWEVRGNGTSADYEGGVVHHTVGNSSAAKPNPSLGLLINGRSDLSGPLCNVTGPWCSLDRPKLHVVAAHPANHAGASGGRSMGPLPVSNLFNKRVFGLEIDYPGNSPMTSGQYRAALIFSRALVNVLRRSIEYVRAHAETSITGKWDPGFAPGKTIDMGAFRRDAANLNTAPKGIFAMLNDNEQAELLIKVRRICVELMGPGWEANNYGWATTRLNNNANGKLQMTLVDYLRSIDRELNSYLSLSDRPGQDADSIFGQVLSAGARVKTMYENPPKVDSSQIDMSKVQLTARAAVDIDDIKTALKDPSVAKAIATELAPLLADIWDARARDNNPATGPVT